MKKIAVLTFLTLFFINVSIGQNVVLKNNNGVKYIDLKKSSSLIQSIPVIQNPAFNKTQIIPEIPKDNSQTLNWTLSYTASGKVFKDVSFANVNTGYIVTELGSVYKTTNGGLNWLSKMNLGFPYYWYGVATITSDTVVIAGFNDQGNTKEGVIRWTYNGGDTWTSDIILRIPVNGVGWLDKIRFLNSNTGLAFAATNGAVWYTNNGGKDTLSWTYIQINSDLAWYNGSVDLHNNGYAYTAGIHFAKSTNFGLNWISTSSADYVFDGGVNFLDNNLFGYTGGGQISSPVSGWVHRTTDGGTTWSGRLNVFDYPVRALKFFTNNYGFISGGNVYSEAGFIYSTSNGGSNWNLEVSTSAEMFSIGTVNVGTDSIDVWVVGSTGSSTGFIGKAYKTRIGNGTTLINNNSFEMPDGYKLFNIYPNPYNPETTIKFQIPQASFVTLKVYNIQGRLMKSILEKNMETGTYEVTFNSSNVSSGIYFVQMIANKFVGAKKMLIVK